MAEQLYECVKCSELLPEAAFKFSAQKGGRTNQCKRCAKNRDCLRMWGKTYDQMAAEAGHRCGICGDPEKATWRGVSTSLSIDYERLLNDPDLRMAIRKWIGAESDR